MSHEIQSLFDQGQSVALGSDETLFATGERVQFMYLTVSGAVDLLRYSIGGLRMTLHRAGPGDVLAEASAYSDSYHCDGTASAASRLLAVPVAVFRDRLNRHPAAASAWAASLARSLQGARANAEIRSLRKVAERLDAWLAGDQRLPPKGEWQALADILGVSREALYRELAKRREAGLAPAGKP